MKKTRNEQNKCSKGGALPNDNIMTLLNELVEKIADIENVNECLDAEVNRVIQMELSSDVKIGRMNHQLHTITAKYIDHQGRLNEFLNEYRQTGISKKSIQSIHNCIDPEATDYIPNINNNQRYTTVNIRSETDDGCNITQEDVGTTESNDSDSNNESNDSVNLIDFSSNNESKDSNEKFNRRKKKKEKKR